MSKNIQLIVGSIRGKIGDQVADWIAKNTKDIEGLNLEVVAVKDANLPLFDAPISPARQPVDTPEAKAWAQKISSADGYIFLTSEYNRSIPPSLANAFDYLKWDEKPVGIIAYGMVDGGASATSHLTDMINWFKMDIRGNVNIPVEYTALNESGVFADPDNTLSPKLEEVQALAQKLIA